MKNNKIFDLTLFSIFAAITFAMGLIPQIGFITIIPGLVSITLVHIPIIIGIIVLPKKYVIPLGIVFTLVTWIASLIYAVSPFDLAFQNILIPLIPKIIFVVITLLIYEGMKKIKNLKFGKTISFGISSLIISVALFLGFNFILENTSLNYRIMFFILVVLIAITLTFFYHVLSKKNSETVSITITFVLATITHTILILLSVYLFKSSVFFETFGNDKNMILIIFSIAGANGIIEALVAALVGTPIIIALSKAKLIRKENIS